MNLKATLNLSPQQLLRADNHHTRTDLSSTVGPAGQSGVRNVPQSGETVASPTSKLLIGEAVRHGRHGPGQVLSHWPDGTVLIRFDRKGKSVHVWPSFLERLNGKLS